MENLSSRGAQGERNWLAHNTNEINALPPSLATLEQATLFPMQPCLHDLGCVAEGYC